jgi:hypothetical protein
LAAKELEDRDQGTENREQEPASTFAGFIVCGKGEMICKKARIS